MSKSKITLKSGKGRRDVESQQRLLPDSDEDEDVLWATHNEILDSENNKNSSSSYLFPFQLLFRMCTSIGLCFSIIFIVFDSFKLLLAVIIFDNILSIVMMVLSMVYSGECPLEKQLAPTLFAYAFTNLVKTWLSIWSHKESFKDYNNSSSSSSQTEIKTGRATVAPSPSPHSVVGKRLQFILFNGLQLVLLGFCIFSWVLIIPMYSILDKGDDDDGGLLESSTSSAMVKDSNSTTTTSTSAPLNRNKVFYWYSFSFLSLKFLYIIVSIIWIPCITCCLLKE